MSVCERSHARGSIPEKVTYISTSPLDITRRRVGKESTVKARPAFPVEAGKSLEVARRWAQRKGQGGVQETTEDNQPFSGLVIWDLDERGQGGRAYKVLIPANDGKGEYLVDLREPEFLYLMFKYGIRRNGKPGGGKFIWGKNGTQMRLLVVGCPLHKALIKSGDKKALMADPATRITARKLEVGVVYKSNSGEHKAYIGPCKMGGKKAFMFVHIGYFWRHTYPTGPTHKDIQQEYHNHGKSVGIHKGCPSGLIIAGKVDDLEAFRPPTPQQQIKQGGVRRCTDPYGGALDGDLEVP